MSEFTEFITKALANPEFKKLFWQFVIMFVVLPRILDELKQLYVNWRNRQKLINDNIISIDKTIIINGEKMRVFSIGRHFVRCKVIGKKEIAYPPISSLCNGNMVKVPIDESNYERDEE